MIWLSVLLLQAAAAPPGPPAARPPTAAPFTDGLAPLAAVTPSGGFNDSADQKRCRLLRGSEAKGYDGRQFRKEPVLDPKLQPGDKIEVPQSFF